MYVFTGFKGSHTGSQLKRVVHMSIVSFKNDVNIFLYIFPQLDDLCISEIRNETSNSYPLL